VNEEKPRTHRLLEIIAVLLLAVATVGTAWCGYQASQWNGAATDLARASSDDRVEAGRLFGLATQRVGYDSTMIVPFAVAARQGDTKLTDLFRQTLIRPDFGPILDQWQATVQAGGTPTNIFDNTDYLNQQFGDYQAAVAKSAAVAQASQQADANNDAYVLTTILLAVAMFFAGVTSSFHWAPARVLLLILALGAVAIAGSRLAELPVIW
jgi:hypothetical protein